MMRRLLMFVSIFCLDASAAVLKPGKVLSKPVSGGQTHFYSIKLKAGEYLYVEAMQHDVHLRLRLHAPDRKVTAEIKSLPGTTQDSVEFHAIVGAAGSYRVEVVADDPPFVSGRYELKVAAERTPTDVDKKRVEAEKLYAMEVNADSDHKIENAVHLLEAQKVFGEIREFKRWADMYVVSGEIFLNRLKHYDYAETQFGFALQVFDRLKNRRSADMVLTRLGLTYTKLSKFDQAFHSFELALKGRSEARDRLGEAEVLEGMGTAWRERDRYDMAKEYCERALKIYREVGGHPLDVARELDNLGQVYLDLNQYQTAIKTLEEALAMIRRFPDPYQESYVLLHLGQGYAGLGDGDPIGSEGRNRAFKKAIEILIQARNLRPREEDFTVFYSATVNYGLVQMKLGLYAFAIDTLDTAMKMAHMDNEPRMEAIAMNLLATAYRTQPRYDLAISRYEEARTIFHEIQSPRLEAMALAGLMRCWNGKEQPRVAIFYGKQAVNLLQSVRSNNHTLAREMQESFLKANEEPYHDLAELLMAENRLPEAEQVINLLKEQEYRDYVRGINVGTAVRQADLTPDEAEWTKRDAAVVVVGAERDALSRRAPLTPEQSQKLAELERDERESNRRFQSFLASLKQELGAGRADAFKDLEESQGLMSDLRKLAETREPAVVIYTLVTEKKYFAILIDKDKETPYEYPISAVELNKLILDFRQVVQNPALDPKPLANRLYQIVMGKMAADLQQKGAKTIMWSLDGCLRYLPLAALYDGQKYLVEQYRMSVFTPASRSRLRDAPSAKWAALGLGVTKEQGEAKALPEVASELNGIIAQGTSGGVLPGEIVLDEQFTQQSMRSQLRKKYPVVHIASHFQSQPGDESKSFLLLGDGSHFTIADLKLETNLFDGVQLLTLSACNTGVSQPGADGKEVESFGVLAQREGAEAVVASLWPVADSSTSLMMRRFYQVREASSGISKLAALQQAQLALLHGDLGGDMPAAKRTLIHEQPTLPQGLRAADAPKFQPDTKAPYAHPYYWAAFYLMGNWL